MFSTSLTKILIIQTAFLGDVILATPVAEKLHRLFPDAEIDFLLRKGNEGLFSGHPFLNKVIIWDRREKKYRNLLLIIRQIRQNKYNLVVNLHRFGSSGLVTALSKVRTTIGFRKNPFSFFFTKRVRHFIGVQNKSIHEIDRNLSLIVGFGDSTRDMPRLYPSEKDFLKFADIFTTPYICIAPASVWFTKQFPKELWIEFVMKLPDGFIICFLGSQEDKEYCQELIIESGKKNCINFAGEISLLETAALMKNASLNYVNDSAPLHIASAVNAAVMAVFCSTVPAFGFGPLSENSRVIETKKVLECRPCSLHGRRYCPENHFECAYTIDINKLVEVIKN